MRPIVPVLLALVLALPCAQPAGAQQAQGPRKLGQFQSWTAAAYNEGGHKVCYAFTRASKVEGAGNRQAQQVLLTITQRPQGRDQVALRVGYTYPRNAEVKLQVGPTELPFYTAGADAFSRDGAAAVRAFRNGREVVAQGPGPNNRGTARDQFPLAGFTQAYEAITKECPAAPATSRSSSSGRR